MRVEYSGVHWFPVGPADLWDTPAQLHRYGAWWSWLDTCEALTGSGRS